MAGAPFGPTVTASAVQPPGVKDVSYVATLPIDKPGAWRLVVSDGFGGRTDARRRCRDGQGPRRDRRSRWRRRRRSTRRPLADAGGIARAVTTDPAPDLRLSTRSTTDALAEHTPFVLVVDSVRFRVSPACGRAVVMARYLARSWTSLDFIHLEPYRYAVVHRHRRPRWLDRRTDADRPGRGLGCRCAIRGAPCRCRGSSLSTATGS